MSLVFEGIRFAVFFKILVSLLILKEMFYFIPAHSNDRNDTDGNYACNKDHSNFY